MRKTTPPPAPPMRRAPAMTKREFMQQYVLNRSANIVDSIDSMFLVSEAEEVWTAIERRSAA